MKIINYTLLICLVLTCISCQSEGKKNIQNTTINTNQQIKSEAWKSLFNNKDLTGWHLLPGGSWKVENGIIIGNCSINEPLHGILLSDSTYRDFKLKVVYKAIKGNSGVYFRVDKVKDSDQVNGLQAEIDPRQDAGGLYETGGRMWVFQPTQDQVKTWYKPNEWNEMIIDCKGKDVAVWLNGIQTVALNNDPGRTSGYIGIQLHGSQDMEIQIKEIQIIEK